jgi:hypothetical protein
LFGDDSGVGSVVPVPPVVDPSAAEAPEGAGTAETLPSLE